MDSHPDHLQLPSRMPASSAGMQHHGLASSDSSVSDWANWYLNQVSAEPMSTPDPLERAVISYEGMQRQHMSTLVARAAARRRELADSSTALLARFRQDTNSDADGSRHRRHQTAVLVVGGEMQRLGLGDATSQQQQQQQAEAAALATARAAAARRREYEAARRSALAAEMAAHPNRFGATQQSRMRENEELRPLSAAAIDALTTFVWDNAHDCRECTICTHTFSVGETLIRLPCNELHCFHSTCISAWLTRQASCPLCRKRFAYAPEGRIVLDSKFNG